VPELGGRSSMSAMENLDVILVSDNDVGSSKFNFASSIARKLANVEEGMGS
jgi:hypothetical protein